MNTTSLRYYASVVLTAFSTSIVAPLAGATAPVPTVVQNPAPRVSPVQQAVALFYKNKPVYEKKGLEAFLASFPKELLAPADQRYIISLTRGWEPLPILKMNGENEVIISEDKPNGESLTLTVKAGKPLEFLANGHPFKAEPSLKATHKALLKALGYSEEIAWSPMDWMIPTAHAGGSRKAKAGLAVGIAAAALGLTAIVLAAVAIHNGNSSDGNGNGGPTPESQSHGIQGKESA
jgi:hypothetical protein